MYENLEFPAEDLQAKKPYIYINMVSSLDGRSAVEGKAGGIGSSIDRETMRILRSSADAVVVGAGTLRAEKVSLTSGGRRSPEPLAVVVSGAGDLPLEKHLIDAQRDRTIIIVPDSLPQDRREILSRHARILAVREISGLVDLEEAIRLLKEYFQVDCLLVEGGPSLNHAIIAKGLADEVFLTLAPKMIGGFVGEIETILNGSQLLDQEVPFRLLSVYLSGSELFLRYQLR